MTKKKPKTEKECPKEFTFLEDVEKEEFYGRCKKNGVIQIVTIDSSESYGKSEEPEEFLVELTELDPKELTWESKKVKEVMEAVIDPKETWDSLDLLGKALQVKQYGYGDTIPLGEKRDPYSQKLYSAKVFSKKEDAIDFMKKEISKMDTSYMETYEG